MYLKHYNNILLLKESGGISNIVLKVVSLIVFLVMAIVFGLMPYYITRCRTSSKFLSLSNAFSGGLFLGIGLFHVLPESAEMLEELTEAPLAYFFAFFSYALILFVEKVAFNSHSLLHRHEHKNEENEENEITISRLNASERDTKKDIKEENEDEDKNEKNEPMIKREAKNQENEKEEEKAGEKVEENKEKGHDEHEDHEHENHHHKSWFTPYILLLALGFHGLFEGMALGIQSDYKKTLYLFLAIIAHKWAASLTLGISFIKNRLPKKQIIINILIFAFIGPVGLAFGFILSETANENVQGVFLAISVGTFIYIACTEVLVEEFENPNNKYFKFGMFMLGGIFIGGLSLLELILNIEDTEE